MVTKISGGNIISKQAVFKNPGIYLENKKIRFDAVHFDSEINAENCFITPGFIDIHSHGALMSDFTEGTFEAYDKISAFQAERGVTAMLATTLTMPMEELLRCAEFMRSCSGKKFSGAQILGFHLEGPFLSVKNKGAHSEKDLLSPEYENYAPLLQYSDVIKSITVAPDTEKSVCMIRDFCQKGVIVSGGHDNSYEPLIYAAVEAGMSHTTHIFCVMSTLGRTNGKKYMGLTETTLLEDALTAELIADGVHVTQSMARLAYKCKGAKGLCLVSDMLSVGGLPVSDKLYKLEVPGIEGGLRVFVADGAAKLEGGQLNAGSITAVDQMVRNMVSWGFPLEDVIEMATGTPAKVIGENNSRGRIETGMQADICLLSKDLQVQETIVGGETVYKRLF